MTISNIFDSLPTEIIRDVILPKTHALTLAGVNHACYDLVNELAQKFFNNLSLSNDSVIKDTLGKIPSDKTNFMRLNSFCESLQSIGFDVKNACKSLESDSILELVKTENDKALVSILSDIAEAANLPNPQLADADSAREWLKSNDNSISQITTLNLISNPNRLIPPEIGKLTGLKSLNIIGFKNLTTLPSEIGKLLDLEFLNINGSNAFAKLPSEVGLLTKLETLYLQRCPAITDLPKEIGGLTTLTHLSIYDCSGLNKIPSEVGKLKLLNWLVLEGCSSLKSLPKQLGNLNTLRHLNLKRCTSLTSLPSDIKNCKALNAILLSDCPGLPYLIRGISALIFFPIFTKVRSQYLIPALLFINSIVEWFKQLFK